MRIGISLFLNVFQAVKPVILHFICRYISVNMNIMPKMYSKN